MEIWKVIPGLDKYEVSNIGRIRNKKIDRFLNPSIGKNGYFHVEIYGKTRSLHRLIASAFLADYSDSLEVNHKNGKKTDNRVSNLEMTTRSGNAQHMYDIGLMVGPLTGRTGKDHHCSKRVVAMKDGKVIWRFSSTRDAERAGFHSACISRSCRGLQRIHAGFEWRYE